ncbi:MAG: serine hydrolase domain-containing protein [Flavobacterium sp.]|nr:serine hydrolase domain-containing protein [Flavobacterium sp.]
MRLLLIFGCFLSAFTQVQAQQPTTLQEIKTDSVAQKLLQLFANKQADSAYTLAGEVFKKALPYDKWMAVCEKQLYGLMPFRNVSFLRSKNGVNKYKVEGVAALQLLISLDNLDKFQAFAIQPFQDDARKKLPSATNNAKLTTLDKTVDALLDNYINTVGNVGASVAIYTKGKDYYYQYGETAKDNKQLPSNATLYEIGSISKTFTATLLAKAVVDKKLRLQDAITQYLPDSVAANTHLQAITLQQLSNHTSGLPRLPFNFYFTTTNYLQPYENFDDKALFAFLKQFKATHKPGNTYEYSNLAVGLLGVILERIYNKTYEQLVVEQIAKPMGLANTKITLTQQDSTLLAQGYNEKGEAVPAWRFKSLAAGGAIKSNAADLLQYGKQQLVVFKSPLLAYNQLAHQQTFSDGVQKVALGWHFLVDDIDVVWQHGGGTNGCRTMLCINEAKDLVVAVLTNNATNGDALGINLLQALERL